jgi:quinol monooxygenase YgiN
MIVVIGFITIDPAKRDEVVPAISTLVEATRAEEGNIDYRYSDDLFEPNRINIVEAWEDQAAMDVHMGTAHMADFLAVMGTAIGGPVEITSHVVSSSTKLF